MLPRLRVRRAQTGIEEGAIGLLVTLVGQAIVYAVVGLRGSFLRYWLVYWLVQQSGVALAYVCASLAPNMDAANTLLPVYNTCQLLFSGLLIRRKDIAPGWAWWPHTLFVRYGWQAQLMNHFGRNREPPTFVDSETGEMQSVDGVLRRGRTRLGSERRIHPPVLVLLARDRGRRTLESQTRETVSTRR